MIASLPMYDGGELTHANDALWSAVAERLVDTGARDVPRHLERDLPIDAMWSSDELLFSQICGYPFAARLQRQLRIVGVPEYEAPGCTRDHHRSFIIVNAISRAKNLEDLAGAVAVINDVESVTGRHLLGDALAAIGAASSFFSRIDVSGSHASSLARVAEGDADVAAIDCISYHHLAHAAPRMVARTRIVHWSRPTPTPPFVIAAARGEATASLVALALRDAFADPATARARQTLRIAGLRSARVTEYARAQVYAERADSILR